MSTKVILIILGVSTGILLLIAITAIVARKVLSDKLIKHLVNGEYEEFEKLANKDVTRLAIRPFNLFYMQLNEAMVKGNKTQIKEISNYFNHIKMNDRQAISLYSKLFYYYVSSDDKTQADKAYKKLKNYPDFEGMGKADIIHDTLVDGGYKYLNQVLEEYKECDNDEDKLQCEMMLLNMYTNKGDMQEAKKYVELSQNRMEKLQAKLKK